MKTVLITGASSGIGEALSYAFAKRGYPLVLIGRDHDALKRVAAQCSSVVSHLIVQDLAQPGAAQAIFDELDRQGIHIDILVNNAGFSLKGPFAEIPSEAEHEMIHLQVSTPLDLIKQALPYMKEKKSGHIINIGSVYCFSPVPLQSIYGASKRFLFSFSQSLRYELRESGISVTLVCPGMTRTSFRTRGKSEEKKSWINMEPDVVAEATYRGMVEKKFLVIPGWINKFYIFMVRFFPSNWVAAFTHWCAYSFRK